MRAPRRRYALSRVRAGDYLLPSNDGKTIWRIKKYIEGPSSGLDWPKDREVWAPSAKFPGFSVYLSTRPGLRIEALAVAGPFASRAVADMWCDRANCLWPIGSSPDPRGGTR